MLGEGTDFIDIIVPHVCSVGLQLGSVRVHGTVIWHRCCSPLSPTAQPKPGSFRGHRCLLVWVKPRMPSLISFPKTAVPFWLDLCKKIKKLTPKAEMSGTEHFHPNSPKLC